MKINISPAHFRNFIFGVEDSLVSTVGLLSGVAIANVAPQTIFLTGLVLIFVEAFSMAAGSFLSEEAGERYAQQQDVSMRHPFIASVVMFVSYFVSGFVPLLPYILLSTQIAFYVSIAASLFCLFLLGVLTGKVSKTSIVVSGLRMAGIGGAAIAVGVSIGLLVG